MNWRHARFAGFRPAPKAFSYCPEPRTIGSFAKGQQLVSRNFLFAGELVEGPSLSIWAITTPSSAFLREQHGFAWLDDLVAVGDNAARNIAQQWIFEWINIFGAGKGPGWGPGLTGRRLIQLCSNAEFILHGLDAKNTRKIFRTLGRQTDFLSKRWRVARPGLHRFEALSGLIYAGLSLKGRENVLASAVRGIAAECQKHIGKDGGIPTRSPEELMAVFTLLTWVRNALIENKHKVDDRITDALHRMAPTLRGLRLGDGTLVRFHGGGRGMQGQLDQSLADAQIKDGTADQKIMGFERMATGRLVVITDCAAPPATGVSQKAHASTLAFEMSSGRRPMIVNCGAGHRFGSDWTRAGRKTAAHNTLQIENTSSAKFSANDDPSSEEIIDGPDKVTCNRASDLSGVWLVATHNGYARSHGMIHERRLFISADGREVAGEDKLSPSGEIPAPLFGRTVIDTPALGASYVIHFHMHPDIVPSLDLDGQAVSLTLKSGEVWVFRQNGGLLALQDSAFLDRSHIKPRATKQIVVSARAVDYNGQITWNFLRAADGGRNTRDLVIDDPAL